MAYVRSKAIDYARTYWNQPCEDGTFWFADNEIHVTRKRLALKAPAKDGWLARFVDDGSGGEELAFLRANPSGQSIPSLAGKWDRILVVPWEGLGDCAHYLCECLKHGGLVGVDTPSVPRMIDKLRSYEVLNKAAGTVKTLAEQATQAQAQRVMDTGIFREADMIGYFNIDPKGDYNGARQYAHSTMYVGKDGGGVGRITCHTKCRFGKEYHNDEWWLSKGSYTYTLIHIVNSDDPPRSPDAAKALEGWWRVSVPGTTWYYYFAPNGTVRRRTKEPKAKTESIGGAAQGGYWFEKVDRICIFWPKDNDLDELYLKSDRIKVNGLPTSVLAPVF